MPFYDYSQNNSGGAFTEPWHHIIVEAPNGTSADNIATQHGVYFDGCENGRDCSCCGDRWYSNDNSYNIGEATPQYYGIELEFRLTERELVEANPQAFANSLLWHPNNILVLYADGTRREWHFTDELMEYAKKLDRDVREFLYGFRIGPNWVSGVYKCYKHDTLDDWYAANGNDFIAGKGWRNASYGSGLSFGCESRKEAVETQKTVKAILAVAEEHRQNAVRNVINADTTLSDAVHKKLLRVLNA